MEIHVELIPYCCANTGESQTAFERARPLAACIVHEEFGRSGLLHPRALAGGPMYSVSAMFACAVRFDDPVGMTMMSTVIATNRSAGAS